MDGDGPSQSQGELPEDAEFFLFYLFFLLVVGVAHVAPHFAGDFHFGSVFHDDVDMAVLFVYGRNGTQSSVYPTFVLVVFDENDLCAGFEFQFHQRGERTFRELALYFAFKECAFGVYFG